MKTKLNCVMLIDDNEDDNYYHQIILKETEIAHKIEVAESGIDALKYLRNTTTCPELIFLDINMPKMNGWEFLAEYDKLSLSQKAKVVIIMLTTSLNPADKAKAKHISALSGFESKPLTEQMLTEILNRFF